MTVVVETAAGAVRGIEQDGGVRAYLGIPYAQPPTGPRRFAPPRPAEGWTGIREAIAFGPAAAQLPEDQSATALPPEAAYSEDCLSLNVWTAAAGDDQLPVLVWFHGGGYRTGGAAIAAYDGRFLAREQRVVVVTCGYRLGALGFLCHPELADEADGGRGELAGGVTGNWGLLDQQAALAWVRENIGAFGGDPGRVTIFGESAGASAIGLHLTARSVSGLFHRAILQSGSPKLDYPDAAAELAERLARDVGCADVRGLRQVPVADLLAAQAAIEGPGKAMTFLPVLDGGYLSDDPLPAIAAGSAGDVDVLIGSNADEWRLFQRHLDPKGRDLTAEQLSRRVQRYLGEGSGEVIEAYRRSREQTGQSTDPGSLWFAIFGDAYFRVPTERLRSALAAGGSDVFGYLFTWPSPGQDGWLGACHTLEIPFVFGTIERTAELAEFTGGASGRGLSRQVMRSWASFAADGRPADDGLGRWPAWDDEQRRTMVIGESSRVVAAPDDERLRLLQRHLPDATRGVRITTGGASAS